MSSGSRSLGGKANLARGILERIAGQRTVALLILLVVGVVSLPVAAYFLDSPGRENWIVPAQLLAMAAIGALVGRLFPGIAGSSGSRPVLVGAITGVVMALVGVAIFFLLLNGFSGA